MILNKHQYSFDRRTNEELEMMQQSESIMTTEGHKEFKNTNGDTIILPTGKRATNMTTSNQNMF